jgi:predicted deacylase
MREKEDMTYLELIQGFKDKGYRLKCYGAVRENHVKYPLFKIVINPQYRRTLLITSGFHGEEFNGPISLLEIFDELVRCARERRVRLIVYPCVNPSGFDLHKRYNASDEGPNNYFLHYQIADDKWVGSIRSGEAFGACRVVNSSAKEVRFLKRDVTSYRVPHAVLDIHQQEGNLDTGDFFAYIFDRERIYQRIMRKLKKIAKVARNDSATHLENGRRVLYKIDSNGLVIKLHDGTMTDMFFRQGSEFVVAAETSTKLPLELVSRINLIWAKELIRLIARK